MSESVNGSHAPCGASMKSCAIPIVRNHRDGVAVFKCRAPAGGDKTVGVPVYTLVVTNPVLPEE